MINKRLINLCKDSKKYIALTILVNWISVLCNIVTIILIGQFINKIYIGQKLDLNGNNVFEAMINYKIWGSISLLSGIIIIAILLAIRYSCNILYAKFSNAASANARVTLRELIYKKLLKLGNGYTNVESTSAVVQVSVEGIEQLEIYFGKYLSQFFYALLVPVTLFAFMSFISFKAALVFILCVPLIPISIIAIMKIAKRILKDYWKSYSDLGGTFLENLQGLTTLKVFNIDEKRHEKMNEEAEKFRKITMKVLSMQLNSITIMDLVAFGGAAAGTIVALIVGENQVLARIIEPILVGIHGLPLLALGPLFVVWFGIGIKSKIVMATISVFFLVFFNIYAGIKDVDVQLIQTLKLMRASKFQIMQKVILPSCIPWMMASLKAGVGGAVLGAIVGEYLGATAGLGWVIQMAGGYYNITRVIACVIILMVIMFILNAIVSWIDRKVLVWRPSIDK